MPLPPAPSRRAALLAPEAFEVTARPRVSQTSANEPVAAHVRAASATRTGRKAGSAALATPAALVAAPLIQVETQARVPEPASSPTTPTARATGTRKARTTSVAVSPSKGEADRYTHTSARRPAAAEAVLALLKDR